MLYCIQHEWLSRRKEQVECGRRRVLPDISIGKDTISFMQGIYVYVYIYIYTSMCIFLRQTMSLRNIILYIIIIIIIYLQLG
jgi:hypothetical protein